MAKEGISMVIWGIAISILIFFIYFATRLQIFLLLTFLAMLFTVFTFYFFRDPDRVIPDKENIIVSPADGRILAIDTVQETSFINGEAIKVSIFLSVFNVHITRIPISGTVKHLQYKKGKFLPAFADKASQENEQMIIGIETEKEKILFKLIAGLIARRVVCHLKENQTVTIGKRCGMIKFGSRVDIFLPKQTKILVKKGDKVKGGESIIGELI